LSWDETTAQVVQIAQIEIELTSCAWDWNLVSSTDAVGLELFPKRIHWGTCSRL